MYGVSNGGMGAGSIVTGSVILPNTNGSVALSAVAIISIAVGLAIIITTVIRFAVKTADRA